jgi:two-component system sensor histidine kinase/response regulator
VLLAEDNPINQRVASAMLEHLGYEVDVVSDGADAVQAAMRKPYRAILMDCQLPGLDGYQATDEIRRLEAPSKRTPIIAVTGSTTRSEQQRCLSAGMDDYLAKPFSMKDLAAVLTRWAPAGSLVAVADDPRRPVKPSAEVQGPRDDPAPTTLDALIISRLKRLGDATGQDLMSRLATMFLADADVRIGALRQELAGNDADAVVRSAHTLSGSSANLGATDLARLCATLATSSAAGDPVRGRVLIDGIEAELGRVRAALGLLVPAG